MACRTLSDPRATVRLGMMLWEIVLLVWVAVIPATVLLLTEIVARRRRAAVRLGARDGALDQPGQLLRLAPHARRREHVRPARPAHRRPVGIGQRH